MPRARTIVAGRDTRQRILDAARDLFYEKGYAATGLAEILQRANEFNVIARVQPDTWLVEDVQDTYQLRTDLCCEAYALGFTATQRADGSV